MKLSDVTHEIAAVISELTESSDEVPASMVVEAVLARHRHDKADPFHRLMAREQLKGMVRSQLNRAKAESDEQLVLPGMQHMQKRYTINRGGEPTIVALQNLSETELIQIERMHVQQSRGHMQHAREIRSYRLSKFAQAA